MYLSSLALVYVCRKCILTVCRPVAIRKSKKRNKKRMSQNIPMSSVAMSAQASVKRKRLVEVLMEMFLKMTMQTMELPSVPVMPIST